MEKKGKCPRKIVIIIIIIIAAIHPVITAIGLLLTIINMCEWELRLDGKIERKFFGSWQYSSRIVPHDLFVRSWKWQGRKHSVQLQSKHSGIATHHITTSPPPPSPSTTKSLNGISTKTITCYIIHYPHIFPNTYTPLEP